MVQLQSKPRITIEEVETRFGLSRRTIFRDIKALIEAGIPIGGDAGEGYFIVEGYHLPPVVFSKEEATALLLGAKFMENNSDSMMKGQLEAALIKVKSVLKNTDKEFVDSLDQNVAVMPNRRRSMESFPDSNLEMIHYAIAVDKVVSMTYHSGFSENTTKREVEPLGVVFYSGRWHLIAYCRLRKALRDFRTDRISDLKTLEINFNREDHPNYLEYLTDTLTGTDAKEAVISVEKKFAKFFGEQKYNYGYLDEEEKDGRVEMRFFTPSYEYLGRWLLMYGDLIEIVRPDILREEIRVLTVKISTHFQKT